MIPRYFSSVSLSILIGFAFFFGPAFSDKAFGENFFQTPLTKAILDKDNIVQWHDGEEHPIVLKNGAEDIVVTKNSRVGHGGVAFGKTNIPGPRHLRLAFIKDVPVGTLLIRGLGRPGVLKEGVAVADADLTKEELWIPGQRIHAGAVTEGETKLERGSLSVWIFPPNTKTSAIRFTHTPETTDRVYAGWLGGMTVLQERVLNIAPSGSIVASTESQKAERVIDKKNNDWKTWDNGAEGAQLPISPERPETLIVSWDKPVKLCGIGTVWSAFGSAEVDVFVGSEESHPAESTAAKDWKTIAASDKIDIGYNMLGPNWFDFGQTITTKGVRLRITSAAKNSHPHIHNKLKEGKRVWLGELFCMMPMKNETDLAAVLPRKAVFEDHPPLPIRFTLEEDAIVTLVLEKEDGTRVCNLVADRPFSKGENVVYWDGSDDLLRDPESANHGFYNIPKRLIEPGKYRVRGLSRKPIKLHYEFSIYNEGTPPWSTADNTGGWLTNHTPPYCAIWVPASESPTGKGLIYLGSYVSEGGHGLAWFEIDTSKPEFSIVKKGGVGWVGGHWTGAQFLTRDTGQKRNADHFAYVISAWGAGARNNEPDQDGEIRISGLRTKGDPVVVKYRFEVEKAAKYGERIWSQYLTGVAVRDNFAYLSMGKTDRIVSIDLADGSLRDTIAWKDPRGMAFDEEGTFYLLAGDKLYRWKKGERPDKQESTAPLVAQLDDPKALALDGKGNIFISEQGSSHHVRVFDKTGKPLRTIGKTGTPTAGPYDELRMNRPNGLAVDEDGRLWVTETDFQPKRVSVWKPDGTLIRAFYGPSEYGGGGQLDPVDPNRFYYHGMEFRLDWEKGTSKLVRVYYRKDGSTLMPKGHHADKLPETVFYPKGPNGPRYMTNCFNSNPTSGTIMAGIWYDDPKTGIARLVSVFGQARAWSVFTEDRFKSRWPEGIDLTKSQDKNQCRVLWCDRNDDGAIQPEETQFAIGGAGGVTVGVSKGRLHYIGSRITDSAQRGKGKASAVLYRAVSEEGTVPAFDLAAGQVLASDVHGPRSSGGDQVLYDEADDRSILTLGVAPFSEYSLSGTLKGNPVWSYPNVWPGLHASHKAPPHQFPEQIVGPTRLLGDLIKTGYPRPAFALNGNHGTIYLFSSDGLLVARLFNDNRRAPAWRMPIAERNMDLTGITLGEENFWPSITQMKDGRVFLVDGARTSLVRVDGLDTVREIKPFSFELTKADLETAGNWLLESESRRQGFAGRPTLRIPIRSDGVKVDGTLDEWTGADWATIDRSGIAAYFNADTKPYDISAALCISEKRLVAAFRTNLKDPLKNSGEVPNALFKSGGCLDLMIATNPEADDKRQSPVPGDMRLLVAVVKKKPTALLYRAVVPGTKEPVPFSSPWRTITLDRVDDISDKIEFAEGPNGVYEVAIPLDILGLAPQTGMKIRGDVGLLRGNGFETIARTYWSNKASAITSDVPSEAQLAPALWGNWVFE